MTGHPDKVRFALGTTINTVKNKAAPWSVIVDKLTSAPKVYETKEESIGRANILGGPTDGKGKEEANVLARSMLTLDFDDLPDDFEPEDMGFALDMLGYASIAYSTFSHKTERAQGRSRLRVIVLLSEEIPIGWYAGAVRSLVDELGIECSPESYTVAQVMFLHSAMVGHEDDAWVHAVDGEAFGVDEAWGEGVGRGAEKRCDEDDDDLLGDIAYEPLDVTWAEVDKALELFAAEGLEYDDWLMVGLGLWHQSRGDLAEGYDRWVAWSEKSSKHRSGQMKKKWKSMGGRGVPVTMASVFARIGGLAAVREALIDELGPDAIFADGEDEKADHSEGAVVGSRGRDGAQAVGEEDKDREQTVFDKCATKAKSISSLEDWEYFKKKVSALGLGRLGSDHRAMLANEVWKAWGREAGLGKTDIKKALAPPSRKDKRAKVEVALQGDGRVPDRRMAVVSEADCWNEAYPDWLQGWVYDESRNRFVDIVSGHAINREAFCAKYDRHEECEGFEMDAASLALKKFPVPSVVGSMYWPGEGRAFRHGGMSYVNSWSQESGGLREDDIPESGSFEIGDGSAAGEACAIFMRHLELIIADERERRLVIDFMAWVYQNPGKRVRWALLMWGVQGNGKTYLFTLMQQLMGRDARAVNAQGIEERFTGWAEGCRLVGLEEVRIAGTNKWRVLDRMKPFISNDVIDVEKKGQDSRVVPNFASYMMFTNHRDAIPVDDGDRRYFVVMTRQEVPADMLEDHGMAVEGGTGDAESVGRYFDVLFDKTVRSVEGLGGIARFLLDWSPCREFHAEGRAPETVSKRDMMDALITDEDDALSDALSKYRGPYINDVIIDLTQLYEDCEFDGEIQLPMTRAVSRKLGDMGFKRHGRYRVRGRDRTLYYRSRKIGKEAAEKAFRGEGVM